MLYEVITGVFETLAARQGVNAKELFDAHNVQIETDVARLGRDCAPSST